MKVIIEILLPKHYTLLCIRSNNIIQLLTGFEENSSFVWRKDESFAQSHKLRTTDPFEGQTINCWCSRTQSITVIHHFFKIFLFTLSTHISIICFQYPRPSSLRIYRQRPDIVRSISRDIEPMIIRALVNNFDSRQKIFFLKSKCVFIVLILYRRKNYGV